MPKIAFSRRKLFRTFGAIGLANLATPAQSQPVISKNKCYHLRWQRVLNRVARTPLIETGITVQGGEIESNAGEFTRNHIKASATPKLHEPYWNAIDLTTHYTYLYNEGGFNNTVDSNEERSGISAYRVRAIQAGQGDLTAFNASMIVTATRPDAQHWLAAPAAILFGGTIVGAAEGAYLNPFEIYLTDKPRDVVFNCAAVGAVYNLDRNVRAGNRLGQIWSGIRVQSVGSQAIDNMLSGTGKFVAGIDLSMPALDFGPGRAAIALKAGDRIYFNTTADEQQDPSFYVRSNWVTSLQNQDYSAYDSKHRSWRVTLDGQSALAVSAHFTSVRRLIVNEQVTITGNPVEGWNRMKGVEDRTANLNTASVTIEELARRVKALETALHAAGGFNGFLKD